MDQATKTAPSSSVLGADEVAYSEFHGLYKDWEEFNADQKRERAHAVCNMLGAWAHMQKMDDRPIPQDLVRAAEIDLAYQLGSADTPGTCMVLYSKALEKLKKDAEKAFRDLKETAETIQPQ